MLAPASANVNLNPISLLITCAGYLMIVQDAVIGSALGTWAMGDDIGTLEIGLRHGVEDWVGYHETGRRARETVLKRRSR